MDKLTKPTSPRFSIGAKLDSGPVPWSYKVPGPGTYTVLCGVGQPSPTKTVAQQPPFGRAQRKGSSDTKEHALVGPGAYSSPSQLGAQLLSTRPSSPMPSIVSRIEHKLGTADTQGPGVCRKDSFFDPHSSPNKPWAPQYSFGVKAQRSGARREATPGPGSHLPQNSSFPTKKRAPAFSVSGRHDVPHVAATNIGPGRCRNDSSLGTQKVSTQKNYPAFSFGRRTQHKNEERFKTPGPGSYG